MVLIGAAPCDHLHFAPCGAGKAGGGVRRDDAKFLETLDRRWHHGPRRGREIPSAVLAAACGAIGCIATVQKECVLVASGAGNLPSGVVPLAHAIRRTRCVKAGCGQGLQEQQGRGISGQAGNIVEHLALKHIADRGIHSLQFNLRARGHFYRLRHRSNFEFRIGSERLPHLHVKRSYRRCSKAVLLDRHLVGARRHTYKSVITCIVGGLCP